MCLPRAPSARAWVERLFHGLRKEGPMPDPHATLSTVSSTKPLDGARALRELIRRHHAQTDEARQLAQPVVDALASLGVFRALVPASAGGEAWAWPTWM